jgi:succinate-semialdehyde dehydrogenase/glutarate-semialdehyde dehydrogenase
MLQAVKGLPKLNDAALLRDQSYINGAWVGAAASFDVTNPADGVTIGSVPNMGATEAQQAIDAAAAAFPAWSAKTGKERAAIMRKWFDLMIANADDLAALMTAEQGKPLAEAKGEVMYGASFIEWFAEEAKRVSGDVMSTTWSDKRMVVLKQPIGVCASITPWMNWHTVPGCRPASSISSPPMPINRLKSATCCAQVRPCVTCRLPDRRRLGAS